MKQSTLKSGVWALGAFILCFGSPALAQSDPFAGINGIVDSAFAGFKNVWAKLVAIGVGLTLLAMVFGAAGFAKVGKFTIVGLVGMKLVVHIAEQVA